MALGEQTGCCALYGFVKPAWCAITARLTAVCVCVLACPLQSGLRTHLDPDTLTVLDAIMATEEMEAVAMQQEQVTLNEPAAPPAVHIEEVHEHAELDAGASAAAEPMN